jgi:negative regulator of flagellin synthesis FlgM
MKTVLPPDVGKIAAQTISENSRLQKSAETARSELVRQPLSPELVAQGNDLMLSGALESAMRQAEFDENKVRLISEAIREGNYPLDARRIAESFVPLEKLL